MLMLSSEVVLVDIVSGVAIEDYFGLVYVGEGMIIISWNWVFKVIVEVLVGMELFILVLCVESNVMLSEVLGVSLVVIKVEVYGKDGIFWDVVIEFSGIVVVVVGFEFYQNQFNFFKGEIVIGFNFLEVVQVIVMISDVIGKVLKFYCFEGIKGYN